MSVQKPAHECYICFFHNQWKLETTKMSFTWWMDQHMVQMDKQIVIHPDNGISFSNEEKMRYQATKLHGGNLKAYCQVKETSLKRLHSVWSVWCFGKGRTREVIKRSVVASGWGGGWWWEVWSTVDFDRREAIFYATAMVNTCHYAFVKTQRLYNTECLFMGTMAYS